jgi:membrane associated rhomboid family serine protease
MGRRLDRADRMLGRLVWKPLTFLMVLFTALSVWMAIAILRETDGTGRVVGFLVAVAAALVFGAGAWITARKRRLSEMDWS